MLRSRLAQIALSVWCFPTLLQACPVCHSETGDAVRAGIQAGLGTNFIAATSPLLVVLLIIFAVTGRKS